MFPSGSIDRNEREQKGCKFGCGRIGGGVRQCGARQRRRGAVRRQGSDLEWILFRGGRFGAVARGRLAKLRVGDSDQVRVSAVESSPSCFPASIPPARKIRKKVTVVVPDT